MTKQQLFNKSQNIANILANENSKNTYYCFYTFYETSPLHVSDLHCMWEPTPETSYFEATYKNDKCVYRTALI